MKKTLIILAAFLFLSCYSEKEDVQNYKGYVVLEKKFDFINRDIFCLTIGRNGHTEKIIHVYECDWLKYELGDTIR